MFPSSGASTRIATWPRRLRPRFLERGQRIAEAQSHAAVLLGDLWGVDVVLASGLAQFRDGTARDGHPAGPLAFDRKDDLFHQIVGTLGDLACSITVIVSHTGGSRVES